MKKIAMVDLKGQYQNIKAEIDNAIAEVIENTAFIKGSSVLEFKKDLEGYLKVKHAIPCGNGTDALQLALMALDLKPGDEVITSSFTFIATAEVIALLGLQPVFVDVEPDTFNLDPNKISEAITSKTKAIIPVHLFGQCCNMDEILSIAEKNNLFIIEDNAQAIGADYTFKDGKVQKAGTIGNIGCTSFFPSKNLGAFGDGGALFTNNDELADKIQAMANHGMKIRYYHDYVGVNSRLDTIQAAILKVKLKYLDDYISARKNAARFYDKAFGKNSNLIIPARSESSTHVFHQYTLQLANGDRQELIDYLKSKDIPAMIYYPVPLHLQKAYNYLGYKEGQLPITENLCTKVFSLPMHTELESDQLEYITDVVNNFTLNN